LNFLVDAQLPPALAQWISARGHPATHVFDIALVKAPDADVWEHARRQNAIVISKDEDFVDRWLLDQDPVALIWIRRGNLWPDTLKRLEQGERLIELRE